MDTWRQSVWTQPGRRAATSCTHHLCVRHWAEAGDKNVCLDLGDVLCGRRSVVFNTDIEGNGTSRHYLHLVSGDDVCACWGVGGWLLTE